MKSTKQIVKVFFVLFFLAGISLQASAQHILSEEDLKGDCLAHEAVVAGVGDCLDDFDYLNDPVFKPEAVIRIYNTHDQLIYQDTFHSGMESLDDATQSWLDASHLVMEYGGVSIYRYEG